VKAATIIFAELTLAVTIVFIVLLLVRAYGWSACSPSGAGPGSCCYGSWCWSLPGWLDR